MDWRAFCNILDWAIDVELKEGNVRIIVYELGVH